MSFVPAPNTAREFLAAVPPGEEPLLDALERHLRATTGVVVPREAWDWSRVAEHLRPTYRVVDEGGGEQGRGKDLEALKEPLRPQFAAAVAEVAADTTATGRDDLDLRRAPGRADLEAGRSRGARLPRARRRGRHGRAAGVRVDGRGRGAAPARRRPAAAARAARSPTCSAGLDNAGKLAPRRARRTRPSPSWSRTAAVPSCWPTVDAATRRSATSAAYDALLADAASGPRAADARGARRRSTAVLARWRRVDRALSGRAELATLPSMTDMRDQLARLVHRGFVAEAGAAQLRRYPTYLDRSRAAARPARRAARPRPAAARPDRRPAGGLPPPGRRAARRATTVGGAARGALAAGGVPGLAVGPAARHASPGQRPAHPQGAGLPPPSPNGVVA